MIFLKQTELRKTKIDYAIDFLFYSYFRLDINSSTYDIVNSALDRAYLDAVQQGAYNTLVPDNMKSKSAEIKELAKEQILKFLSSVSIDDYRTRHDTLCDTLVNLYSEIKNKNNLEIQAFTFGNAQKWVNMTTKYIYLICVVFSNATGQLPFKESIYNKFIDFENILEIPIDSFILEKIWNDLPQVELPLRNCHSRSGKWSNEKVVPWSQWNKDMYVTFRNSFLQSVQNAIMWENTAWIEIAQKRKSGKDN